MELTFKSRKSINKLQLAHVTMCVVCSLLCLLAIKMVLANQHMSMTYTEMFIQTISMFFILFIGLGSSNGVILTFFMKNPRSVKETVKVLSYSDMKSNGTKTEAKVLFQNRQEPIRISVNSENDIRVGNNFNIEYDIADTLFYCQILYNVRATPCV